MPMMKKDAQLVFVPSPGVGHLVSTIEFVKLLVNRDDRIWVTVLVMKLPFDTTTGPYTETLASYERVKVINLPECHVPTNSDGPSKHTFIDDQKPNVKEVVSNLTRSDSEPQLAAFVVDMFCTTMIDVAKEFGVPTLVFFTSGIAFLGLMLHLHTLRERDNVDISELEESDTELAIPSFVNPVPSKAMPSLVLQKEWETVFLRFGKGLKEASGIIVNSFEELESHAVHSFSGSGVPIYPVGPILNPKAKGDQVTESHSEILKWLDDQPHASVIFLCFGSMGYLDDDQIREIARALESSGARFLWSIRKPPPKGSTSRMVSPSDYSPSDLAAVLPEGFLDRTAGIGRVLGWAPQAQVLAHPATGGFVSHCGWNSTLESIYFGVPIATWPLHAEQQTNAFELVRELKMAVEIAVDYRVDFRTGSNYVLSGEKIERGIRSVLEKDGEIRKKVKEMSEKSKKTLSEGGCSSSHLERLIDYITSQV